MSYYSGAPESEYIEPFCIFVGNSSYLGIFPCILPIPEYPRVFETVNLHLS